MTCHCVYGLWLRTHMIIYYIVVIIKASCIVCVCVCVCGYIIKGTISAVTLYHHVPLCNTNMQYEGC